LQAQPSFHQKNVHSPKFGLAPNSCTGGSTRHRHTKHDITGQKLASTQTQSSEFLSKYVKWTQWSNSRLKTIPKNRKVDRWHEAIVSGNIWHQCFLVGIVENKTMLSRSALAQVFDNVKASISKERSAFRAPSQSFQS
jgi:hypothetical protein